MVVFLKKTFLKAPILVAVNSKETYLLIAGTERLDFTLHCESLGAWGAKILLK